MFKFLSIIFSIAAGYFIFEQVLLNTTQGNSGQEISCVLENDSYYSCGGWPIFTSQRVDSVFDPTPDKSLSSSFLLKVAKLVVLSLNALSGFSAGYAQIISVIVLYSKFIKGVWSTSAKEIIFSFIGGAIIYVSLANSAQISSLFMNMTMYLLGFTNHHGNQSNVVNEALTVISNWNSSVRSVIEIQTDQGVFSFNFFRQLPETIISYFLYLILQLPLVWFSILNIIMMAMQQFLLLSLPIDAIRMSMSVNIDPFLIIRKLFALSMLSMSIITEFKIISWIPDPPLATVTSIGAVGAGIYIGFFWSAVVILGLLVLGTLFSTIAIFKSFYAGKESIGRL